MPENAVENNPECEYFSRSVDYSLQYDHSKLAKSTSRKICLGENQSS